MNNSRRFSLSHSLSAVINGNKLRFAQIAEFHCLYSKPRELLTFAVLKWCIKLHAIYSEFIPSLPRTTNVRTEESRELIRRVNADGSPYCCVIVLYTLEWILQWRCWWMWHREGSIALWVSICSGKCETSSARNLLSIKNLGYLVCATFDI